MLNNEDFYYEYTRKRDIHLVEDVARYLCDRFPLNYSHLVLELCKMYLNQKRKFSDLRVNLKFTIIFLI